MNKSPQETQFIKWMVKGNINKSVIIREDESTIKFLKRKIYD